MRVISKKSKPMLQPSPPLVYGVFFYILSRHHTSFHMSALAKHPFTCVPQQNIIDITEKKLEVSTSVGCYPYPSTVSSAWFLQ